MLTKQPDDAVTFSGPSRNGSSQRPRAKQSHSLPGRGAKQAWVARTSAALQSRALGGRPSGLTGPASERTTTSSGTFICVLCRTPTKVPFLQASTRPHGKAPKGHRQSGWVCLAWPTVDATSCRLEGAQECHQILLFLRRKFRAEDQVEELDRVLQRQQTLVVHIGRVVLGAAQREGFDRTVPDGHHVVDHHRLEEALRLEVMHQVTGAKRWLGAARAVPLAEEDRLAP